MEDVKELKRKKLLLRFTTSFNPCFNGRCKRTPIQPIQNYFDSIVSILVLMEDVKEQISDPTYTGGEIRFQSLF